MMADPINDYSNGVFVSYRRDNGNGFEKWVRELFVAELQKILKQHLPRDTPESKVWMDEQLVRLSPEYLDDIKRELYSSRVLVPILSVDYFTSEYCRWELAHMIARQQKTQRSLICPVVLFDGINFPERVKSLFPLTDDPSCHHNFRRFATNVFDLDRPTIAIAECAVKIREFAEHALVPVIGRSPQFESGWNSLDATAQTIADELVISSSTPTPPPRLIA